MKCKDQLCAGKADVLSTPVDRALLTAWACWRLGGRAGGGGPEVLVEQAFLLGILRKHGEAKTACSVEKWNRWGSGLGIGAVASKRTVTGHEDLQEVQHPHHHQV